jgi:hypothetical protein
MKTRFCLSRHVGNFMDDDREVQFLAIKRGKIRWVSNRSKAYNFRSEQAVMAVRELFEDETFLAFYSE